VGSPWLACAVFMKVTGWFISHIMPSVLVELVTVQGETNTGSYDSSHTHTYPEGTSNKTSMKCMSDISFMDHVINTGNTVINKVEPAWPPTCFNIGCIVCVCVCVCVCASANWVVLQIHFNKASVQAESMWIYKQKYRWRLSNPCVCVCVCVCVIVKASCHHGWVTYLCGRLKSPSAAWMCNCFIHIFIFSHILILCLILWIWHMRAWIWVMNQPWMRKVGLDTICSDTPEHWDKALMCACVCVGVCVYLLNYILGINLYPEVTKSPKNFPKGRPHL